MTLFAHWVHPVTTDLEGKDLLIVLHGYGSNEQDLASLAPFLPEQLNIVALRAPLVLPHGGFSWFPIAEPGHPDLSTVEAAVEKVLQFVESEVAPLNPASVGVLGFSQGGAMTIELLRARPELFAYGLNLSGFAVQGERARDAELRTLKPQLFWGYDVGDPVIHPAAIARTADFVPEHFSVTVERYPGIGHSISREELTDISAFIEGALDASRA